MKMLTQIKAKGTALLLTLLCCLFSAQVWGQTYKLATSTDELDEAISNNLTCLIVNTDNEKALGSQNTNNRAAADIIITDNTIEDKGSAVALTLGGNATDGYTFYDATEGGYLYAASSTKNYLKTTTATNDDNAKATITFSSNDDATIKFKGSYTHNLLRYNATSTSKIFSCYASGQEVVQIFVEVKVDESTCQKPKFSVAGGTYNTTQSVELTSATEGASIYYTTDDTDPSASSTAYTSTAITVDKSMTIKAIAIADGKTDSEITSATYTLQTVAPTFDITGGNYYEKQFVRITTTTEDASIYYTTDGSEPTAASTLYNTDGIAVNNAMTIKAIAVKDGWTNSDVTSAAYTFDFPNPTFTPAPGIYTEAQSVTIQVEDGLLIYYTTDGSDPWTNPNGTAQIYGGKAITVSENMTIKCVVGKPASTKHGEVVTATYTIKEAGDGSFEKPYSCAELKNVISGKAWVEGYIIGAASSSGGLSQINYTTKTNVALADVYNTSEGDIAVAIGSSNKLQATLNIVDNPENIGKKVKIYGTVEKYFNKQGIKPAEKVAGLNSFACNNDKGYATFYCKYDYEMPEGLTGGIITAANDESLTIDYKYEAGKTVPAGSALLIKGCTESTTYDIINTSSSTTADADNLLHGANAVDADGKTFVAGDVKYYILSHDAAGEKLGFYWAAEDGAAITYKAPYAFLAVPTTAGAAPMMFSLEGNDATPTGIENATAMPAHNAAIYNVNGVRMNGNINALPKGIYIVGGKKLMVK